MGRRPRPPQLLGQPSAPRLTHTHTRSPPLGRILRASRLFSGRRLAALPPLPWQSACPSLVNGAVNQRAEPAKRREGAIRSLAPPTCLDSAQLASFARGLREESAGGGCARFAPFLRTRCSKQACKIKLAGNSLERLTGREWGAKTAPPLSITTTRMRRGRAGIREGRRRKGTMTRLGKPPGGSLQDAAEKQLQRQSGGAWWSVQARKEGFRQHKGKESKTSCDTSSSDLSPICSIINRARS